MKLRNFVGFFFLCFFWTTISLCMEERHQEENYEETTLLTAQSAWSLKQKVYHGLYIGGVATLAFTGQYLTIKNYYDDHPQSDDLTGVWSGVAVALSVSVAGVLAYVGGKHVKNCHENRNRQRSHFAREHNENEEL